MLLKRIWGMGLVLMVFVGGVTLSACSQATAGAAVDSAAAAEAHAFRWQAMGQAYERMGLLNVDSAAAAEAHAFRWQAMADFYARYARHGILYE